MSDHDDEQVPQKSLLDQYDDETPVEIDLPHATTRTTHVRDLKGLERAGMITVHQRPDGSVFFILTDAAFVYVDALQN